MSEDALRKPGDGQGKPSAPAALEDTVTLPGRGTGVPTPQLGLAVLLSTVELPVVEQDRYTLYGEFARGGMGCIFHAYDARLGRRVALKQLQAPDSEAEKRFRAEAFLTARLQHPGIVSIYDMGRWPTGECFYSMRFVPGRSLDMVIREAQTLSERMALLPHALAVAEAVAYAHSQGIIHRDLKPTNVLVGEFGETVVIDWGLAKELSLEGSGTATAPGTGVSPRELDEGLTVAGTVMGTPAYMPPEQARGEPVDERADVYALGAIIYRMLSGCLPYEGTLPERVLQAVLEGPPPPLSSRQSGVPQDLITLVSKAMAREPKERYPTARELAEDLRRFQTGQIVGAHAYTWWELFRRFVRRYRAVLSVAAVALWALAGMGAVSTWQILAARDRAERNEAEALNRADTLSLMQARTAVEQDPNAVALLRKLSPGFTRWQEVRLIAADAKARGLATLLKGHKGVLSAQRFLPDGEHIITSSDDQTLRIWDLTRHGQSLVLAGHTDEVWNLAVSEDGQWAASAGKDGTVRLWEVATGESRVLAGHEGAVVAVAFLSDGKRLVSAARDGTVRLWERETGKPLRVFPSEDRVLIRMAVSPDMRWVATAAFSKTGVRLWSLESGEQRTLVGHQAGVRCVVFSPGGALLATGGDDGTVRVWDPNTGKGRVLGEHLGRITTLAFSPDGRSVAAGGPEHTVRWWDVATGQLHELVGHEGQLEVLTFSPDGRLLASGGHDRSVRLWELSTGKAQVLHGPEGTIYNLSFSPDGRKLAVSGGDAIVRVYELQGEGRVLQVPNSFGLGGIRLSADGRRLAAGSQDGIAHQWDLSKGTALALAGHRGRTVVALSADGSVLASGGEEGAVRLWDPDGRLLRVLDASSSPVTSLAFSPDGRQLASASLQGEVRLWELATGQMRQLQGEDPQHPGGLSLTFSPAGSHLAAMAEMGTSALLWDLSTGERKLIHEGISLIRALSFSPDGHSLATGGVDNIVRLWDMKGNPLLSIHAGGIGIRQVVFSPDGRTLATRGERESFVRLWDARSGERLAHLEGHNGNVNRIAISPDSKWLATASDDQTVRLWDMESHKSRVLRGHTGPVADVLFSPDGRRIFSLGADDTLRIWPDDLPSSPEALRAWLQAVDAPTLGDD